MKQCIDIIQKAKNDLEISSEGKLIGGCDNNSSCKACMDAINKSVSDVRLAGGADNVEYDAQNVDVI
jgi:hypothetical protein